MFLRTLKGVLKQSEQESCVMYFTLMLYCIENLNYLCLNKVIVQIQDFIEKKSV